MRILGRSAAAPTGWVFHSLTKAKLSKIFRNAQHLYSKFKIFQNPLWEFWDESLLSEWLISGISTAQPTLKTLMHGHIADKAPGALLRPQLRGQIRRNFDIFSRLNLSVSLTLKQNFSKFLEMRSISATNFFQNLFWDAALPQAEFSTHSLRQNFPKILEMRSISTAN